MRSIRNNQDQPKDFNLLINSSIQNMEQIQVNFKPIPMMDIKKLFQICNSYSRKQFAKPRQICSDFRTKEKQYNKYEENEYKDLAIPTAKKHSSCEDSKVKIENTEKESNFSVFISRVQDKFQQQVSYSYQNLIENWTQDNNSNMQIQQFDFLEEIKQNPQMRKLKYQSLHQNNIKKQMNKYSMDYMKTSKKNLIDNNKNLSYKFDGIKKIESCKNHLLDAPIKQKLYREVYKLDSDHNQLNQAFRIKKKLIT